MSLRNPADPVAEVSPRRIHVIFKTHLDVGFTDLSKQVVSTYVERFIPQALAMARQLREREGRPRFVWTTGSWLIHHYLEVVSPAKRRELERAIEAGDIVWHGLPFTTHTELMDAALFRRGLGLSQGLDTRFGRKTIAAKMTDVPGHTRAMVPLLAEAGVEFLHIGVNPASKPPAVPDAFRWRDASGAAVDVIYDKGSYGGLKRIAGCEDAIYFAHTGDNLGPCSPEAVDQVFADLEKRFPDAEVRASTLNDFALGLRSAAKTLPVVTQELGDTWIHGVGTDPKKVGFYRELLRWRTRRISAGRLSEREQTALKTFEQRMLMVPEHTWGMDVKIGLGHEDHYDKRFKTTEFKRARKEPAYRRMETSWREQRAYLTHAIDALRGTPAFAEARALSRSLAPRRWNIAPAAKNRANGSGLSWETPFFDIGLDAKTGAIRRLHERAAGRNWADAAHVLGQLNYEVFSADDYAHLWKHYSQGHEQNRAWAVPDFLKPGVERAVERHQAWLPALRGVSASRTGDGLRLRTQLAFDVLPSRLFGCPRTFQVEMFFSADRPEIRFTVQWFDKQACRVPEATWFSFRPKVVKGGSWRLGKLGRWIDPRDVIQDGNRTLHAVERCRYDESGIEERLIVENPTAPLVAPGKRSLVRFSQRQPEIGDGMHFNLHNNTWGTNFPLWYEDDARFDFTLRFNPSGA